MFSIRVSASRAVLAWMVELTGGRQRGLTLGAETRGRPAVSYAPAAARMPRVMVPSAAELAAHEAFLDRLKAPIWREEG